MRVKARALIALDGRVVVAEERRLGRRHLTLPGGRPARGETLQAAVRREVREETGLDVTVGRLLYVAEMVAGSTQQELNLVFLARIAGHDVGSAPTTVGPNDAERHAVLPPIMEDVFADLAAPWPPAPRYLGNVHRSLSRTDPSPSTPAQGSKPPSGKTRRA